MKCIVYMMGLTAINQCSVAVRGGGVTPGTASARPISNTVSTSSDPPHIVQEVCESRGGRPGLSVLTSLLVSVDVKLYSTMFRHWSQLVPNMPTDI